MLSNLIIKPALNLNGKTNKEGLRTIVITIYQPGTRLRTSINTKIRVKESDFKFGKVQPTDPNYDLYNRKIKRRIRKLMELDDEMEAKDINITPKKLKEYYKNNLTSSATLQEWVNSVILPSTERKATTKNSYQNLVKSVDEYSAGITIKDLSYDFLVRYSKWMKDDKKLSHNTIVGRMKSLKCLCNEAIKRDIIKIDEDPFKNYTIKEMIHKNEYLTEREVNMLDNFKDVDKKQKHIKDAFVFCCCTGLRFSDFEALKEENFDRKKKKLTFNQRKTGSVVELPLGSLFGGRPFEIISSYSSVEKFSKIGHNSTANKILQSIGRKLKIKTHLHFHLARHTCATLLNAHNMKMQEIQHILGHARMDTTSRIYAVTDYKQLKNSLEKAFKTKKKNEE